MYSPSDNKQLEYRINQLEKTLKEIWDYLESQPTLILKEEIQNIIQKGIDPTDIKIAKKITSTIHVPSNKVKHYRNKETGEIISGTLEYDLFTPEAKRHTFSNGEEYYTKGQSIRIERFKELYEEVEDD